MDTSVDHARRRGRPPKLKPAELDALVKLVRDNRHLSLGDTVEDTVAASRVQRGVTFPHPPSVDTCPLRAFISIGRSEAGMSRERT